MKATAPPVACVLAVRRASGKRVCRAPREVVFGSVYPFFACLYDVPRPQRKERHRDARVGWDGNACATGAAFARCTPESDGDATNVTLLLDVHSAQPCASPLCSLSAPRSCTLPTQLVFFPPPPPEHLLHTPLCFTSTLTANNNKHSCLNFLVSIPLPHPRALACSPVHLAPLSTASALPRQTYVLAVQLH